MAGISFLFWNLKQQPLRERIARLVVAHAVDVVIVAECATPSAAISRAINDVSSDTFHVMPGSGSALRLFTRISLAGWRILLKESLEEWLAFRLATPSRATCFCWRSFAE